MATYRINHHMVTGKRGIEMYKNQEVDESNFVDGSIDNLVKDGSIELVQGISAVSAHIVSKEEYIPPIIPEIGDIETPKESKKVTAPKGSVIIEPNV